MAKATIDRPADLEVRCVRYFVEAEAALDSFDPLRVPDPEAVLRQISPELHDLICVALSGRDSGAGEGSSSIPEWVFRTPFLLARLSRPLTAEEEADPYQVPSPSIEIGGRAFCVLLSLVGRGTPRPIVSPNDARGLEVIWHRKNPKLTAGFEVEPGVESVYAWGTGADGNTPWSGTVDDSRENIERTLRALAAG